MPPLLDLELRGQEIFSLISTLLYSLQRAWHIKDTQSVQQADSNVPPSKCPSLDISKFPPSKCPENLPALYNQIQIEMSKTRNVEVGEKIQ